MFIRSFKEEGVWVDLTLRGFVKMTAWAITLCCAFFLFAQYNTRKNLPDEDAKVLIIIASVGIILLFVVGIWDWVAMTREENEFQAEVEEVEEKENVEATTVEETLVTKLCWGFQVAGLAGSCWHTVFNMLAVLDIAPVHLVYGITFPYSFLLFLLAFFSDPKSGKNTFEWALFLTLSASEVAYFADGIRSESTFHLANTSLRVLLYLIVIHFSFKFRARLAEVEDTVLSNFLLGALSKIG